MPRRSIFILSALFIGISAALPVNGFMPRPEPDEWPTLEFRIFDSEKAKDSQLVYSTMNGEVSVLGETIVRAKYGDIPKLKSPLAIDIRGHAFAVIQNRSITPTTETVLLIDQVYNPALPYGGITENSHIIRESPLGGWAQRFLGLAQEQELQRHMWRTGKLRYEAIKDMQIVQYPTEHLQLESYKFSLSPGKHTIQVLMRNADGKPINQPITTKYLTVIITPDDVNYWRVTLPLAGLMALIVLIIRYRLRARAAARRG